ncbi:aminotransferase class I/II-fold pyridoxal phosphate-dependent enzyme [Rhizobium sp. NLR22b]|uniref:aminotransferase class I/II-fold pyridoxal phosphate-dependent enzyme n=1 Tax=Rhizobium sp. NLR22b TaxID=2731115 RepID=UPI001C835708|nr:aminotransferase class I/II-fold pyridoxal phosphate-dependent enzyme [Rhizobium sp. NLR22b]MBX5242772.1 aminotransferase class I/II-fold pyridoxal phosphate-dependent enzyme [Rhizobium sp. NLR22b]
MLYEKASEFRLHLNEPWDVGYDEYNVYPDASLLTISLSRTLGISRDNLLVTAGSDQGIDAIVRSVKGTVLVLDPDFPRYVEHAQNAERRVIKIPLSLEENVFPVRAVMEAAIDAQLVFFSSVGNPTGYTIPDGFLEEFCRTFPEVFVCVDDCYREFLGTSTHHWAAQTPNILSIGSISKVGFPGLRIGYAVGAPQSIERIRRFVSPFAVAGHSLLKAEQLLGDPGFSGVVRNRVADQVAARDLLADSLRKRQIRFMRPTGNWILARFGEGATWLAEQLKRQHVLVQAQSHPLLREWIRISTPNVSAIRNFIEILDEVMHSTIEIKQGLFKTGFDVHHAPNWHNAARAARIGNKIYGIDHIAITVKDRSRHENLVEDLIQEGGTIVEGPGIWPNDFCEHLDEVKPDLSMNFATVKLRSGGMLVISAPVVTGDQIDRWRRTREADVVHHIAIHTNDISNTAAELSELGWKPLTKAPVTDGNLEQWFLHNEQNQILELIRRHRPGVETFSCGNISELRKAEKPLVSSS